MFEETGCDAVMIGRAAMKNPLIFSQIDHYLKTGELLAEPSLKDIIDLAVQHSLLMAEQYGEERGMKMMRKYLGWYVKGLHGAAELRSRLFQVNTLSDIRTIFDEYQSLI